MSAVRPKPSSDGGPKLRYMPALDGLRGVAVSGVILFHAGQLRGGFLGVDLFFVLSGFLITSLLLAEVAADGHIRLGRFWARRAWRLLPPLLLLLLAVTGYAATAAAPTELERLRGDGLAALFYYANWHALFAEQSYWEMFSVPSPLAHTWSLAIEEQFYLLWPLAIVALRKLAGAYTKRAVLILCIVGAFVSWGWMAFQFAPGIDTSRMYYGADTRACALLIGSALAAAVALYGHPIKRRFLDPAAAFAFCVLAAAWWWFDGQTRWLYQGGFMLCQLATVVVLAMAAHPERRGLSRILAWGPLGYLGRLSYSLYLWHWPVFVVVTEARFGMRGAALLLTRLGLSLALASFSYHVIEQPLRRGLSIARGRRGLLLMFASIMTVTGAIFVSTESRGGHSPRARLWLPAGAAEKAPLSLLIAGDSVAERIAVQLSPLQAKLALRVHAGAAAGCGLIEPKARLRRADGKLVLPGAKCAPLDTRWAAQPHADAAVLVVSAPSLGEYEIAGTWRKPCEVAFDSYFEHRAQRAIDALAQRAAMVYLASMPYVTAEEYGPDEDRHTDCLNRALVRAVAGRSSAKLIDLAAHICPEGQCRTRLHGVLLRYDGQHFEGEAAELIGFWLSEQVRANP